MIWALIIGGIVVATFATTLVIVIRGERELDKA
jgi:hypothetical protein